MGFSAKKSKKVQDTDSDSDGYNDDMEYEEVARDEGDYDEDDGAEEEEEDDEEEEQEGEEDGEEEEEEEGEEEEDEDREVGTDEEEDDEAVERIERENEEMEQLEKEYRELHHQEIDTLKNLKHHKDEDLLKGQAVKSQKALWYKILELRFLLQKPFSSSNRLPQDPIKSSFCESNETVSVAYSNLVTSSKETLDSILELQEALFAKNPSITQATYGSERLSKDLAVSKQLDDNFDQEWSQISQTHKRIASFRDKSINKWQRMTQVTTGAAAIKGKLHAFNQDISNQIATYMRDPSRMMKQMQLRKSSISIFGSVPEAKDNTEEEALTDADPELLDDSEFYQQLLKEFFETVDPSSSEKAFYALKRMQTKKRKIVDRRASKSRKIRYNVHEKIVNFMAPQPMNLPPMAPMLFDNLFGLKTES
ncbi:putative apoptosis-antagonizing transcription factor, AATF leucine zipper-containing [Lupinus albus]|uniref:Putative apoptosis-antagonizing transcription factor, AATF leucine zipper-containing n=1 Tax=Lupinus albus TaxID=3870 RepID=A0A6A4NJA5_LUPAL|nr:putative apoptosis-antagonizing transcription factor, AATF leucine zipper-containing [Lupinus albus]